MSDLAGAHPRVSGENLRLVRGFPGVGGSSPRERGKLRSTNKDGTLVGLIPA